VLLVRVPLIGIPGEPICPAFFFPECLSGSLVREINFSN